jgi:hypothetical protein
MEHTRNVEFTQGNFPGRIQGNLYFVCYFTKYIFEGLGGFMAVLIPYRSEHFFLVSPGNTVITKITFR